MTDRPAPETKQPVIPLAKANEYVMEHLVAALAAHDAFSRPEPMTKYSDRPNRVGVFFGSSGFAMIEVVAVGGGIDMLSPERQAETADGPKHSDWTTAPHRSQETRAYAEKLAAQIRARDAAVPSPEPSGEQP